VIKGVCNQKSELTVKRLNEILDKMVTKDKTEDKTEVFRELYKESNAEEIKWISRIILKDLKLNMKVDIVLNTFHPDGNDYFNLTNSVKETCFKLQSL
jgi:DNA ligase-4